MYCDGKDVNKLLRKMDEEITNFLAEPEKSFLGDIVLQRCIVENFKHRKVQ